jgi:hypothetical protein
MAVPKNMQQELEKRDELILALEMLTVDQASRLLALEALVVNMAAAKKVKAADIKSHITKQSKRFHQHFEGDSLKGFTERAERIAKQLGAPAKTKKAASKKTASKATKAKKAPVKKASAKRASVKKPVAKKIVAKKTPAKKSAAKKAVKRASPAKKAAAKRKPTTKAQK